MGMFVSELGYKNISLSNGALYPAFYGLIIPGASPNSYQAPMQSVARLGQYVGESMAPYAEIQRKIEVFARSRRPIVLWGAGSFCQRIVGQPWFPVGQLTKVVDRDRQKHGRMFAGIEIQSPEMGMVGLSLDTVVICLASVAYEKIYREYLDLGIPYEFVKLT
jgi:hypothetical protein